MNESGMKIKMDEYHVLIRRTKMDNYHFPLHVPQYLFPCGEQTN